MNPNDRRGRGPPVSYQAPPTRPPAHEPVPNWLVPQPHQARSTEPRLPVSGRRDLAMRNAPPAQTRPTPHQRFYTQALNPSGQILDESLLDVTLFGDRRMDEADTDEYTDHDLGLGTARYVTNIQPIVDERTYMQSPYSFGQLRPAGVGADRMAFGKSTPGAGPPPVDVYHAEWSTAPPPPPYGPRPDAQTRPGPGYAFNSHRGGPRQSPPGPSTAPDAQTPPPPTNNLQQQYQTDTNRPRQSVVATRGAYDQSYNPMARSEHFHHGPGPGALAGGFTPVVQPRAFETDPVQRDNDPGNRLNREFPNPDPMRYGPQALVSHDNPYGNPLYFDHHISSNMRRRPSPGQEDTRRWYEQYDVAQREGALFDFDGTTDEALFVTPIPDPTRLARPIFFPESSERDRLIDSTRLGGIYSSSALYDIDGS